VDVRMTDTNGKSIDSLALLDTQCQVGDWVSKDLVEELGKSEMISKDFASPETVGLDNQPVIAIGIISLKWRFAEGNRYYLSSFYVTNSPYLQVIIGAESIKSLDLLQRNKGAILPLINYRPIRKGV
jgi:hypothetical protein